MGMRLGQVVLPLMINLIVAMSSWRHAFGAMAAIVLAAIIPTALYVRRRPEDMGLLPDGASNPAEVSPSQATAQRASEVPDKLEEHWSLREAMRTKALWLLVVVTGGTFFVNGGVNLHAIAYFQDQGLPAAQAVTITTIFASTTVGAAFLWGYLCDRIHVRYACMACSACYLLAMFIIVPAETYPAAVAFGVMFGLASGGWTTVERLLVPNYFGRRSVGAIPRVRGDGERLLQLYQRSSGWVGARPDGQLCASVPGLRRHRNHCDCCVAIGGPAAQENRRSPGSRAGISRRGCFCARLGAAPFAASFRASLWG